MFSLAAKVSSERLLFNQWRGSYRSLVTATTSTQNHKKFKLVVVGGGTSGCAIAAKFANSAQVDPKSIAVLEPSDTHYYQPLWTLVGGGMKSFAETGRPMSSVLPKGVEWIREKAAGFDPEANSVQLQNGSTVEYDFLVVAVGLELKYEQIKGLPEALKTPGVCSNYSPLYVNKTYEELKNFRKGNAIFTFPNSPVKCPGAPQKILYIAEDYFRRTGKLNDATLIYNTSLGVLFGVKHYADALWKVVKSRPKIQVNLRTNLIEVIPSSRKAVFQNLDHPEQITTLDYEFLHVSPPQGPPAAIKGKLSDAAGFVDVNKSTMQHTRFPNVFALGDCSNSPNSKTAAAAAAQSAIVFKNLRSVMKGEELRAAYDGYASCPLVTSNKTCILAEFDYNLQPLETFPLDQARELRSMFYLKRDLMPTLYWNLMLTGRWNGPKAMRKLLHLGFGS